MIWGTTNASLITKVQRLQNFAAKVADGRARKYDHVTPIFKELQWLNIKKQITFNSVVTIFKQVTRHYPDHFLPLPTVNNMTDTITRQQHNLYVPRTKTDSGARAMSVTGPKLWNQLPSDIKEANNLHAFKSKLKKNLLLTT